MPARRGETIVSPLFSSRRKWRIMCIIQKASSEDESVNLGGAARKEERTNTQNPKY